MIPGSCKRQKEVCVVEEVSAALGREQSLCWSFFGIVQESWCLGTAGNSENGVLEVQYTDCDHCLDSS
jgi:hypothetical protein